MRRALVAFALSLVACAHAHPTPCDQAIARLAQLNLRPNGTCANPRPHYLACLDAAKTIEAALDCDEQEDGGLVILPHGGIAGLGRGDTGMHSDPSSAVDAHDPEGQSREDVVEACRKALRRARQFSPDDASLDDAHALPRCVMRASDEYLACVAASTDRAGFLACEQQHSVFLAPKP